MKNMLYFAVFGEPSHALPKNSLPAYGGFGFSPGGELRMPYAPPKGSAILFDDSIIPENADLESVKAMLSAYDILTVFFDFEKPKSNLLCRLLCNVSLENIIISPQYAGVCSSYVLVPAYRPCKPFESYLQAVRHQFRFPMLDLSPIHCRLKNGIWQQESNSAPPRRNFSAKHRCMYDASGTELHFFDTKQTLLARAAASGLPCLLPLDEFEALE